LARPISSNFSAPNCYRASGIVRDLEQIADRSLILGNRIEVAHLTEPVGPRAFPTSNSSGIARSREGRCNVAMSKKSRQVIYGGQIMGAKIRA
jgi:hypothetical protein